MMRAAPSRLAVVLAALAAVAIAAPAGATEICRDATFWATHSGSENGGDNLGQAVLDQTGPLMICRRAVDASDEVGSLGSLLEGLCSQEQGVDLRELLRQLVTADLNCAISEGGSCDQITRKFTDLGFDTCNSLCAGDPVPAGTTIEACIQQLSCFNSGGQMVGGQCVTGTCTSDAKTPCGGDAGACASGGCTPLPGNCAAADLCNADSSARALLCPLEIHASSSHACHVAKLDACTIDHCDSSFDLLQMISRDAGGEGPPAKH